MGGGRKKEGRRRRSEGKEKLSCLPHSHTHTQIKYATSPLPTKDKTMPNIRLTHSSITFTPSLGTRQLAPSSSKLLLLLHSVLCVRAAFDFSTSHTHTHTQTQAPPHNKRYTPRYPLHQHIFCQNLPRQTSPHLSPLAAFHPIYTYPTSSTFKSRNSHITLYTHNTHTHRSYAHHGCLPFQPASHSVRGPCVVGTCTHTENRSGVCASCLFLFLLSSYSSRLK